MSLQDLISYFPRRHALVACAIAIPLCSMFVGGAGAPREQHVGAVEMSVVAIPLPAAAPKPADLPVPDEQVPPDPVTPPEVSTDLLERREQVRAGDNLAKIFKRLSLRPADLHVLVHTGADGRRLQRIFPGEELRFMTTPEGELKSVIYSPSRLESLQFDRESEGFVVKKTVRKPERLTSYRHGTIDQSLFVATQNLGLNDDVALRLAQIFQWDIDFVLDIRKGDQFFVVFEEEYLDDEFIGFGRLLAAEFVNQGQSYRAILYTDESGEGSYYTPNGDPMRKAFLRAPVEFTRISSNFNPRRLHPIHKRVMPHRGIDYAAPAGTPVLAAGDGRVSVAGRNNASGNYVVVQHGEQFQTKYLHLSKFGRGIRSGTKVRQGQIIGYVGATGWATAPHLHYEFLVNGIHKNPRTVPLPKASPIPVAERARFMAQSTPLLTLLSSYKEEVELAVAQ